MKEKAEENNKQNNEETEYKKDYYKKLLILIIGIALIIIFGVIIYNLSTKNIKEEKAKDLFEEEYCDSILHMATKDLVKHKCDICGKEFEDSGMRANICDNCSEELDRCNFCGKKLTEEVKKQRNELLGE